MRLPMTSIESGKMFVNQKNKSIHEQKNNEVILTHLSFTIEDVKIYETVRE
jgi:hypothetical protein